MMMGKDKGEEAGKCEDRERQGRMQGKVMIGKDKGEKARKNDDRKRQGRKNNKE